MQGNLHGELKGIMTASVDRDANKPEAE